MKVRNYLVKLKLSLLSPGPRSGHADSERDKAHIGPESVHLGKEFQGTENP